MSNKMNKKKVVGIVALAALVVLMGVLYFAFREKPVEGSKTVVIQVVDSAQKVTEYTVKTDAQYLQQAMDEAEGLEYDGEVGTYGFTVYTVNGERALYEEDGAYWGFFVNEEYCNYGISEQPVEDGDVFQIVYTPAQ